MKKAMLMFLVSAAILFAANKYQYAEVTVNSPDDIKFLQENSIDIDRTSFGQGGKPIGGKVTVYVTEDQYRLIESKGYLMKWTPLEISKAGFRYNDAIGDSMLIWENRLPGLCKRIQIGTSVQGRPIWVLKISDNVNSNEAEPKVKFVSTMHGDEVTGSEMCMFLAENIIRGYQADNDTMRFIADNTEVFIIPQMNPDGTYNNTRYNANGIDLNRVFPERIYNERNATAGEEPEVAAQINFANQYRFTLSTSYHGGAQVVNYAWDNNENMINYVYSASPHDAHLVWLSKNYASRNSYLMNGGFTDGITNGNEWYIITGGIQDWNYVHYGDIDLCIELSNTKWPPYSEIPSHWAQNRSAMLWYLSAAHKGIYGKITDSATGAPLNNAVIRISGINKNNFSDYQNGNYHLVLKEGTYEITVSANGYYPQTLTGIYVTDNTGKFREATEVNVQLVKKNTYQVLPFTEGMEEYKDPIGWTQPGSRYWIFRKGGTNGSNPSAARSGELNAHYNGPTGTTARMVTSAFDLTYYENVKISYWYYTTKSSGTSIDKLKVYYSKTGVSGTFSEIANHSTQVTAWTYNEISVSNANLSANFAVAFDGIDANGYGVSLDDLSITGTFTMLATPENITIAPNGTDILLNWTAVPGATVYKIYRSSDPYAADWGSAIGTSTDNSFTDLNAVFSANKNFYKITADNLKVGNIK